MNILEPSDGIVEEVTSLLRAGLEIHRLNAPLAQRIAERIRQLREANEALETLCFSVSHDLRMGGRVAVESKLDAGSAFCIDLPAPSDASDYSSLIFSRTLAFVTTVT